MPIFFYFRKFFDCAIIKSKVDISHTGIAFPPVKSVRYFFRTTLGCPLKKFKPNNSRNLRAYPNNRVVMRPSEKSEAKAAGQKGSEAWFAPRLERFFTDNAGIRLPLGIERVIWIGSK